MDELAQRPVKPASAAVETALEAAVERSRLERHPFDHIRMEQVFEPASYSKLLAALPDRRHFHELSHHDAMRADGSSTRLRMYLYPELLRRLPAGQRSQWTAVGRALCSRGLQDAFKRKFRTALEARFAKPVEHIGLYPVPILLRDQPGYRIGIHSDASRKAITVQYYLPADASRSHLGTLFHQCENAEAAGTTQIPFLPASGYAFPVALQESWHSAPTTTEADGERVSAMVTYYVADDLQSRLKLYFMRAALRAGKHPRL